MAENVMNSQMECIFIFGGNGSRAVTSASFGRGQLSNFVETDSASRENENSDTHAATFPVAFAGHFVQNFTHKDGSVVDLFGGTGTTIVAAEQLDRTCYMMELDPKYCDVIRKRYGKLIGAEDWEAATPQVEAVSAT
jgi:DNA modification methylase